VEDLAEDLQEEFAKAQEISDVISQPIGGDVFDDDDLMNELELEMEKDAEDALLQPSAAVAAPAAAAPAAAAPAAAAPAASVPSESIFPVAPIFPVEPVVVTGGAVDEDEMAQLRELEASMAS
jgi:hypothetical protein